MGDVPTRQAWLGDHDQRKSSLVLWKVDCFPHDDVAATFLKLLAFPVS